MIRRSEDISRSADELQVRLAKLRKEARRVKKLEEQQEAEERRQQEIAEALEFTDFAKGVFYPDSNETVYVYLSKFMEEMKAGNVTWGNTDVSAETDKL